MVFRRTNLSRSGDFSPNGMDYIQTRKNLRTQLHSGVVNHPNSTLVTAEWQGLQAYQPRLQLHALLARTHLGGGRGQLGNQPTYVIKPQVLSGASVRYSPACNQN